MAKIVLSDLNSLTNEASALATINGNSTKIEQAFDDALSRTGKTPNQMQAGIDMNSNRITNLPAPINPNEPLRLAELNNFTFDLDERVRIAQEARDDSEAASAAASVSASAASGSAAAAATSAANSETSKVGADTAKTGAETAKTGAETAKTQAQGYAQNANDLANTAANTDVPGYPAGTRSAKHWASVAQAVAGGVTATGTTFTPYGTIASSNVQGAIQELEDDKTLFGKLASAQTWTLSQTFNSAATFKADNTYGNSTTPATDYTNTYYYSTTLHFTKGGTGDFMTVNSTRTVNFVVTPTLPTATAGDNTTKAATTAFVTSAIATETANRNTALAGKSDTTHLHDDRYYTEAEVNTLLAGKQNTGSYMTTGGGTFAGTVTFGAGAWLDLNEGRLKVSRSANTPLEVVRTGNTGSHVTFTQYATTVGSITATSSSVAYNTTSDIRAKKDIMPSFPCGNVIDDIEIVDWVWKNTGEVDKGVIAQQVEKVYPNAVTKGATEDDYWQVDYSKFVPLLLKEIQDLRKRMAELENK